MGPSGMALVLVHPPDKIFCNVVLLAPRQNFFDKKMCAFAGLSLSWLLFVLKMKTR